MYSRADVKAITDKIFNMAQGHEVQVDITGAERSGTRWANSTITTNLIQYDRQLTLTVRTGNRSGSAFTRDFSDAGLKVGDQIVEVNSRNVLMTLAPHVAALLRVQEGLHLVVTDNAAGFAKYAPPTPLFPLQHSLWPHCRPVSVA